MRKLYVPALKYLKRYVFFVVFKKELDNNFESLLLKYRKKSIDHIASKYVNYMRNNPFNKMIKKIISEISIS